MAQLKQEASVSSKAAQQLMELEQQVTGTGVVLMEG